MDKTESRRKFIINLIYFLSIVGIVIFISRYAITALMPFFVAFVISLILRPAIRIFKTKAGISQHTAAIILVLLFYSILAIVFLFSGISIFTSITEFAKRLPILYTETIGPTLMLALGAIEEFVDTLAPSLVSTLTDIILNMVSSLGGKITEFSMTILNRVGSTVILVPGILLDILLCVIATIFISMDLPLIKKFIIGQMSPKTRQLVYSIGEHLEKTILQYIKSYLLIMFITFTEISIGLFIIGINNTMFITAIITIFDVLPIVGSGMILFPWSIITLLSGNISRGIGLLILNFTVIIIRNIVEPKIVGNQVGLNPIVTLLSMVIGTLVFGPIGLLGLPIVIAIIQSLNDEGVINLYKKIEETNEK